MGMRDPSKMSTFIFVGSEVTRSDCAGLLCLFFKNPAIITFLLHPPLLYSTLPYVQQGLVVYVDWRPPESDNGKLSGQSSMRSLHLYRCCVDDFY